MRMTRVEARRRRHSVRERARRAQARGCTRARCPAHGTGEETFCTLCGQERIERTRERVMLDRI